MTTYFLSLLDSSRHLFSVTITVASQGEEHIDLQFPAWSPGRYFIYDFSRNVQELQATGSENNELAVEKIEKGTWRIATEGSEEVRISYKMFGNTLSGTFSQLDDRHASINGSSVFGYIVGRETEPVQLELEAPEGWKVYTSLQGKRSKGRTILKAENYDVLIDSPIEVGIPIAKKFVHDGITYHVVIDMACSDSIRISAMVTEQLKQFVQDVEKTVKTQTRIFGKPEFGAYYFLVNIDPAAPSGDGMEHLASTRLVLNNYVTDPDAYTDLVGVMSHEFFHIWNVKRLRPAELGPFDYTKEHHTTLLWFAEGFTQYYGHLMLRRAGVWDDKQFLKHLASEINAVDASYGRFHRNLRASSFDTWHATSPRNPMGATSNFQNTYVNYYRKGAVAALVLDMEIRKATRDKKSLDDVIRILYTKTYEDADFHDYYLRGSGYTEEDVYEAIEAIAGKRVANLFRKLVAGTDEIDYNRVLAYVGLEARRSDARKKEDEKPNLFLGVSLQDAKTRARKETVTIVNVQENSPAQTAGLSAGDVIVAIDGERVNGKTWGTVLATKRPGDMLTVTLFRGTRLQTLTIRPSDKDASPYVLRTKEKQTTEQKKARKKWLG